MTRTTFKRVPFNLELAKKITNVEVKGHIVTRDGRQARIICFDRKENEDIFDPPKNIVALVANKDGSEVVFAFRDDGMILLDEETCYDLLIEVPNYYRKYSNFEPQKYQPCLVRNGEDCLWGIQVYSHTDYQGKKLFYDGEGHLRHFANVLPFSKATKRLIGTTKSYEQLIQELDAESTATAKNEQQ